MGLRSSYRSSINYSFHFSINEVGFVQLFLINNYPGNFLFSRFYHIFYFGLYVLCREKGVFGSAPGWSGRELRAARQWCKRGGSPPWWPHGKIKFSLSLVTGGSNKIGRHDVLVSDGFECLIAVSGERFLVRLAKIDRYTVVCCYLDECLHDCNCYR